MFIRFAAFRFPAQSSTHNVAEPCRYQSVGRRVGCLAAVGNAYLFVPFAACELGVVLVGVGDSLARRWAAPSGAGVFAYWPGLPGWELLAWGLVTAVPLPSMFPFTAQLRPPYLSLPAPKNSLSAAGHHHRRCIAPGNPSAAAHFRMFGGWHRIQRR